MIAATWFRCRSAVEFAAVSGPLLWTLRRTRRRLAREGMEATVDAAIGVRRRTRASDCDQRLRAGREDEVLCWWLDRMGEHAICLYRSLVMLERLAALPYVETLELVIGVQRGAAGGLNEAHAWLLVNDRLFRTHPSVSQSYQELCRFFREPGRAAAGGRAANPSAQRLLH
ncbi:MAG TPA: lasso peptide biosynthesis protein [Candidatus Dormibacteraeota bacterium]